MRVKKVLGHGTDPMKFLLYFYRDSLITEFFAVFGIETTLKLIKIFGGTTIRVPSEEDVVRGVRDVKIYRTLKGMTGLKRIERTQQLANRYSMSTTMIRKIYDKVKQTDYVELLI